MEQERRNRIRIALWAYAYEAGDPIVEDDVYDKIAKGINTDVTTDRPDIDKFFKENYASNTGMWVYQHPEIEKIKALYQRYDKYMRK